MKINEIEKALQIRYVDLCFTVVFVEDSILPEHKTSALRGGMGQMLLWQYCIRDKDCVKCDFEKECLVRRMMYSRFEIQPYFASRGDSIGYVIECEDKREHFMRGDRLRFHLILFGKTIVYFNQFLQAFFQLGQLGIGKYRARFQIENVRNAKGECVVDGVQVYLERMNIEMISQYVEDRRKRIKSAGSHRVEFQSPVTIKYQGQFIRQFHAEAIFRSLLRRIYSFDCFEGIDMPLLEMEELPKIMFQKAYPVSVRRYSSTSQGKMSLRGLCGEIVFDELPENELKVLLAGEKLHIGKNTSFGFGQYVVK